MHKNRIQSPKEYFTPPTWPPFLCLLLQHGRRDVMCTHSIVNYMKFNAECPRGCFVNCCLPCYYKSFEIVLAFCHLLLSLMLISLSVHYFFLSKAFAKVGIDYAKLCSKPDLLEKCQEIAINATWGIKLGVLKVRTQQSIYRLAAVFEY